MPKRTDLNSILIIGAGPIIIGQACEFDYSGAQACKALKDEGYEVIRIGGEGEYKRMIDIAYLLQRADYHIGAESGMMHVAKFFMDCDRLHIYRNIQRREEQRFPGRVFPENKSPC